MDKYKFEPSRIWNVDESGLSTVPSKNSKIFATKGRKQVGVLTSAERGQHVTVVCAMNVIGSYVPPALIFPRKRLKNELMDNSPPGSVAFAQEKGWMTGPVFLQWLDHFVKYVKPSPEDKILLILDGHGSHKSLEVLEFTKKHGIILFCLPPHTTHRLQPLDVTFYSSLTNYYNIELEKWLKNHPGRVVTHFQVASILKKAYAQAATISTAENGFYQTGIIPLNPDIIPDWMYAAAEPTNIETEKVVLSNTESDNLSSQPCSSNMADDSGNLNPEKNTLNVQERSSRGSSSLNVSVEEIYPLPKAPVETQNRTQRRKGKSGIINATPEIVEAKRLHAEKEAKSLRTAGKKASKNLKNVFEPNESDNSEDDPYETDDEYGDTVCIYCNELFSHSRPKEVWLQCQKCLQWCHIDCAGVSSKTKRFTCDLCK
ncbi:hypothetical protein Zmor_011473 [Zophobas morio]|uniref:Zinc finger PHD-type domain-containing protein n=1 Tax=Zophobas morio TaxID=2755281 RepID=A0AA38IMX9_9CUCU|nr:hypothetical protein Zmor_011473 [Zophobas morio]